MRCTLTTGTARKERGDPVFGPESSNARGKARAQLADEALARVSGLLSDVPDRYSRKYISTQPPTCVPLSLSPQPIDADQSLT